MHHGAPGTAGARPRTDAPGAHARGAGHPAPRHRLGACATVYGERVRRVLIAALAAGALGTTVTSGSASAAERHAKAPAVLAPATPGTGAPRLSLEPPWAPGVAEARAYAAGRPGTTSFVVLEGSRTWSWRGSRTVPSASLAKTLFLVAHLRRGDVRGRPLRREERELLSPMIRRSDDVAATRLRDRLGEARIRATARAAGMRDFRSDPTWGLARTSARDQARFYARLRELVPPRHRAYAIGLLRTVVARQRWGVARAAPRGWRLAFKGGWGSGTGAVDHQSALLERDGRRIALSITTTGNRSHAGGKETLRGVARRLLAGLPED